MLRLSASLPLHLAGRKRRRDRSSGGGARAVSAGEERFLMECSLCTSKYEVMVGPRLRGRGQRASHRRVHTGCALCCVVSLQCSVAGYWVGDGDRGRPVGQGMHCLLRPCAGQFGDASPRWFVFCTATWSLCRQKRGVKRCVPALQAIGRCAAS